MKRHSAYQSQAFIFRCELVPGAEIRLSEEHSDYDFFDIASLSEVQQRRIRDCLDFDGVVKSAAF